MVLNKIYNTFNIEYRSPTYYTDTVLIIDDYTIDVYYEGRNMLYIRKEKRNEKLIINECLYATK
jgi:hypothetical protein